MPATRDIVTARTRRGAGKAGSAQAAGPIRLRNYTVATLPAAASYTYGMVWVSDAATNAIACVSDGTNWKRLDTGATVS
jgi:hypothetical protein